MKPPQLIAMYNLLVKQRLPNESIVFIINYYYIQNKSDNVIIINSHIIILNKYN